ncbi:hypothetical protein Cgig2_003895 [Carnegiea gigantea]|uniref:Uncharacterized protein n=1 Tax=Carnegiea gigantea TaxID=171969 RepID=A0A9Q1Q6E9_9CARY|nr:hypothetical protein Cgig2_003895 [Carnegiea gigantea]
MILSIKRGSRPLQTLVIQISFTRSGEKGNNKDQGMVTNLGKQSLASGSRYTILENIEEDNIAENNHYEDLEIIPSPETDTLLESVPAQNQEQITEHDVASDAMRDSQTLHEVNPEKLEAILRDNLLTTDPITGPGNGASKEQTALKKHSYTRSPLSPCNPPKLTT